MRLDRPPMNAISQDLVSEMHDHLTALADNKDIRAVVVWGGEKIFAAGADIKEFQPDSPRTMGNRVGNLGDILTSLENLPQITISAVNGYALGGGCELAIATDFRVAGENAVFGQPEILLGIIPGAGGTQRLTPLVGISRAKEIVYTGRRVKADEALAIGLVDAVCPDSEVLDKATELAAKYAKGPAALTNAKRAVNARLNTTHQEALEIERQEFAECFKTDDAKIGIKSFLENGPGKAEFTGR